MNKEYLSLIRFPDFQVSMFLYLMSFILMVGLLLLSDHFRSGKLQAKLLRDMCICMIIGVIIDASVFAVDYEKNLFCKILFIVLFSFCQVMELFVMCLWVLYADYMVHGIKDHLARIYNRYLIPVLVVMFLYMGVVSWGLFISPKNESWIFILDGLLYYQVILLEILYLLIPVAKIYRYRKNTGKLVKFRITPLVIPILICILLTELTQLPMEALGMAIGMISIYFSMVDVWKYESATQGYYNREYLNKIREYADSGEKEYGASILVATDADETLLPELIRREAPKGVEMVSLGKGRFIAFLNGRNKPFAEFVASLIQDAVDEYNEESAEPAASVRLSIELRSKDESIPDFTDRMIGKA